MALIMLRYYHLSVVLRAVVSPGDITLNCWYQVTLSVIFLFFLSITYNTHNLQETL